MANNTPANQRQQTQEQQASKQDATPREEFGNAIDRDDVGTTGGTRQEPNPPQGNPREQQGGTGGKSGDIGGHRDLGQRDIEQGQPGEGRPDKQPPASQNDE